MLYALMVADDGRILSVTYPKYASPNSYFVSELPEGDLHNYLYINGEFIYDPVPEVKVKHNPTPQDDIDSMLIDHEYRLTLLELGLNE